MEEPRNEVQDVVSFKLEPVVDDYRYASLTSHLQRT